MILFARDYPSTLAGLVADLRCEQAEIWTFDDEQTRRAAERALVGRGIRARCHSALKPLVCAFVEHIETAGLRQAHITCPRHPDAAPRRFLLESYPLVAMFPDVDFTFDDGPDLRDLPVYALRLTYADGRQIDRRVAAPNRLHTDATGRTALSPCGWLAVDGRAGPMETEVEALFHQTLEAVAAESRGATLPFQELALTVTLPMQDRDLGCGDEVLSLREAVHEDLYFSVLELFQRRAALPPGDRSLQPGQIVPEVTHGPTASVRIALRDWNRADLAEAPQRLETADQALSAAQIAAELGRLPGTRLDCRSVAGRIVQAVHVAGSDRAVLVSAGQHANETSGPVGVLRAARRLAARAGAHLVVLPLENPDGYALHRRLAADNPRHMHHAARYTALGDDLEHRQPPLHEAALRARALQRAAPLLHVNCHGYPAHEWIRPFTGYVPHGFESWSIPRGMFLILRHRTGWEAAARWLADRVTARLALIPGLAARNAAMIDLFARHGGDSGLERLHGIPVAFACNDPQPVPLMLITEYPDETLTGPAFRIAHEVQMQAVLAAYEAAQQMPLPPMA